MPNYSYDNSDCYVLTSLEPVAMMREMSLRDVMNVTGVARYGLEFLT